MIEKTILECISILKEIRVQKSRTMKIGEKELKKSLRNWQVRKCQDIKRNKF